MEIDDYETFEANISAFKDDLKSARAEGDSTAIMTIAATQSAYINAQVGARLGSL